MLSGSGSASFMALDFANRWLLSGGLGLQGLGIKSLGCLECKGVHTVFRAAG